MVVINHIEHLGYSAGLSLQAGVARTRPSREVIGSGPYRDQLMSPTLPLMMSSRRQFWGAEGSALAMCDESWEGAVLQVAISFFGEGKKALGPCGKSHEHTYFSRYHVGVTMAWEAVRGPAAL